LIVQRERQMTSFMPNVTALLPWCQTSRTECKQKMSQEKQSKLF